MDEVESRRLILEAARDQFLKGGYRAATLRKIAGAAGMTTGALYHHYRGKDELFVEVCLRGMELLSQRFDTALQLTTGRPLPERVMALFDAYTGHFLEERGYFDLIETLQTTPQRELPIDPAQALRVEEASRKLLAQMSELIRRHSAADEEESEHATSRRMLLLAAFTEGLFSLERRGLLKRYDVGLSEFRSTLLDRVEDVLR